MRRRVTGLFFFQAEDGIRDGTVTGVQTCALPILAHAEGFSRDLVRLQSASQSADVCPMGSGALAGNSFRIDRELIARELGRSEERRVGKECRSRGAEDY